MKKKTIERKYQTFDEDILDNLDTNIDRLQYMIDRGFTKETLRYFGVGYEDGFIVVPVFDEKFKLVGFTCRNVTGTNPKYKDTGLPKKFLLFNLNNARRYDEVIIVEGPLDAMRVHQAGFPNVVATMMGDLTKWQAELLRNTFRSAIIFTDNDEPGRELGEAIVERLQGIRRYWAEFEGKKDPGEMSDNEIKTVIENKKSHILRQIQGDGHN